MTNSVRWVAGFVASVAVSAVAGGCAQVTRNTEYHAAIDSFRRAVPHEPVARAELSAEWNFQLQVPGSDVTVSVRAIDAPSVVTIRYSDENADRPLYKYRDYSIPVAIRTTDQVLYVYWTEALFSSHSWLLTYDWQHRREIQRWRVDPNDMPK